MTYREYLKHNKDLIAMVHLPALPGTPRNTLTPERIIETALSEALFYQHAGFQTVMIENMHDVPYARSAGAEITALMGIIGKKIKEQGLFCGIQILAGCNIEALGTALAAGLDFIRVEGFVFGHIADE
ncbi:hypothetical protein JW979_04880, partial [bacterium]|nr:hypothetical protein [candidate division CSSED10-310 bacterium]